MKGVIPAAGLGTRLLPATKAQPKEMLPIVDKPAIQYVVEEAADAGLSEVIIVIGPTKTAILEHFSADPKLLQPFEKAKRLGELAKTLDLIRRIPIRFVTQKEPLGLGDAIYQARHVVGNEPFAVLLGDDILLGPKPAIQDLREHHSDEHPTIIGVQRVPRSELYKYGVVEPVPGTGRLRKLKGLVEKPRPGAEPSDLAVIGRYILPPSIFDSIEATPPGSNGEVQLTDALRRLLTRDDIYALELEGRRLDVGGKLEWLKANLEIALLDPLLGGPMREWLRNLK